MIRRKLSLIKVEQLKAEVYEKFDKVNRFTEARLKFNNKNMINKSKKSFLVLIIISGFILAGSMQTVFAVNVDSGDNGKLISQEVYKFPAYEQAVEKTDVEKYASKDEYQKAVADKKFEFSKLRYMSDGIKVVAYLYRPAIVKTKVPVIIFNRGSFVRGDIAPELVAFFHRLASEGFVIVAPMYRGSDGAEGRDEMGGGDLDDLMNVLPLIKSFDFADTNNLFMYGESRGGIMTYLALRRKFPVNAAAVFGAVTNMEGYLSDNSKSFTPKVLNQIWTDFEKNKENILKDRSAISWAEEINTPILLMQGANDQSVNPLQSLSFGEKLQSLNKTYQLIIYAGDNHILSKNKINRDRETISWFKEYIKK